MITRAFGSTLGTGSDEQFHIDAIADCQILRAIIWKRPCKKAWLHCAKQKVCGRTSGFVSWEDVLDSPVQVVKVSTTQRRGAYELDILFASGGGKGAEKVLKDMTGVPEGHEQVLR